MISVTRENRIARLRSVSGKDTNCRVSVMERRLHHRLQKVHLRCQGTNYHYNKDTVCILINNSLYTAYRYASVTSARLTETNHKPIIMCTVVGLLDARKLKQDGLRAIKNYKRCKRD